MTSINNRQTFVAKDTTEYRIRTNAVQPIRTTAADVDTRTMSGMTHH